MNINLSLVLFIGTIYFCAHGENTVGKFRYFAYGSNLLAKRLLINNPSAVFCGIAKLDDYRLDFNIYSDIWNGAAATIVEDPGEVVWGNLWTLDVTHLKHLDEQEAVDIAWYFAKNVTVTTPDGTKLVARTYQETVDPPKLKEGEVRPLERRPSNTYLEVIIIGAFASNLPPEYIGHLFSFPTNGKMSNNEINKQLGFPFDTNGTM